MKQNRNTLTVLFEKSKTVSFASSIMKNVVALYTISFGLASNFSCLLKCFEINLYFSKQG